MLTSLDMNDKNATLIATKPIQTRVEKPCLECGIPFPPNTAMHMYLWKIDEGKYDRTHLCLDCKKYYRTKSPEYNSSGPKIKGLILD